jgi:hypothetical protein
MAFISTTTTDQMLRSIQAQRNFKPEARPFTKIEVYVSDCCNATADDWFQNLKRCPECRESCEFEEVG